MNQNETGTLLNEANFTMRPPSDQVASRRGWTLLPPNVILFYNDSEKASVCRSILKMFTANVFSYFIVEHRQCCPSDFTRNLYPLFSHASFLCI